MNVRSHHSPTIYQSNIVQKYFYNKMSPSNSTLSYLSKLAQFKKMQTEYNFSPNRAINNIDSTQTNNTNYILGYQENSNNLDYSDQLAKSMITIYPHPEKCNPNLNYKKINLNNNNSKEVGKKQLVPNFYKEKRFMKTFKEINNNPNLSISNPSDTHTNSRFLQYNEHSKKYNLIDASNKIKKVNNTYYYINKNNSNSNDHFQIPNNTTLNNETQKEKKKLGNMAKLFSSFKTFQSTNSVIYPKENNNTINYNNVNYNNINNNISINYNNKRYKTGLGRVTPKNINNTIEVKNSEKNYINNLVIRTIQSDENSLSQTPFDGKFHSYERTPLINISDRTKKNDNSKIHNLSTSGNFYKKLNLDKLKEKNNLMSISQNKKFLNMTIYNEKRKVKYVKPFININNSNSSFLGNSQIVSMPNLGYESIENFENESQNDGKKTIYKKPFFENDTKLNETNPKIKSKIYQKKQLRNENNKYKILSKLNRDSQNDKINFTTPLGEEGESEDLIDMIFLDRRESIIMSKVKNEYCFYEKKYGFSLKRPKSENCYLTKNILKIFKKKILPLKYISKTAYFLLPAANKTVIKKKIYKKNYIKPENVKNKPKKVILRIVKRKKKKPKENPIKYLTEQKKYIKTQNELLILSKKNSKNKKSKNFSTPTKNYLLNNAKIINIMTEDLENYIDHQNNSLNNQNYDWSITEQIIIKLKLTLPEIIYYFIQITQNLLDIKKSMNSANSYISNILKYYINNYINIHNFLEIHNEIVDLFENIVRNNDKSDDENRLKNEITGVIFCELIKNELFFVSDLNRFILYVDNEELMINIVKVVKNIIISGKEDCSLFEEFNNSAIFKNSPIFFKYVTKFLKINNLENLIGNH